MAGNRRLRIVVQPRDELLLRELSGMRIIDCEQAKVVAGFRSTTRANARLLKLYQAGLLRRFFQGTTAGGRKALYTLSLKGAHLVGVPHQGFRHENDELIVTNFFVAHQSAINEVYCLVKYSRIEFEGSHFVRWLSLREPLAEGIPLTPDGYFEIGTAQGTVSAFLEVDLGTEGSAVWKKKVTSYLRYATSGVFEEQFGQKQFRVLVIANSDHRLQAIRTVVRSMTEKIFWFSTLKAIQQNGFWGSVWTRPVEDTLRSFF
jgi:Replication-relaxation